MNNCTINSQRRSIVPISHIYEYGKVRDFAKNYIGNIVTGSNYADITIGDVTNRFYFNGGKTNAGGSYENVNGSLMMERDDFLKAMGLTYEKGKDQQFTITQAQVNFEKGVDYGTAIIISAVGFAEGFAIPAFIAGGGVGFYTTFSKFYNSPGDYTVHIYKTLSPDKAGYTIVIVGYYIDSDGLKHEYRVVEQRSNISPLTYQAYVVNPFDVKPKEEPKVAPPQPGPGRR
ncbi:hypothetical protein [Paenibacillus radicis (ex Gao et al. 2016)]|uniref:Uncharacterized protein n=1 Tax=Paenibacillus radicis (ex Gao et al. 2016) TaxID=1737354 RepID=A0A917HFE9_9BACL|nr:hypothetical protein [Paenibacillus radicis (ex Gao et al. 2016)]GGG77174.1 hypothetical protein GCM10010918_37250 [Paenibacillus radicis (ex Gao et al. 2016)]